MKTLTFSSLFVVATLALASPAFASEPTPADSETALQLFKEGKALREKGDQQGALGKLRAAYALVETPITALELGRTYIAVGQLVEARGVLLSVSRIPVRNNESTKASEARVEAESLAAELRPRLASLTVRFKGASAAPKLTVDNVVVPADAVAAPRVLNPGAHVVVLEANGRRVQSDVTLQEGQSRDLELEIPPSNEGPVGTGVPVAPLTPPPPPPYVLKLSPLVYVGFGTAIVGLGVGTVTGIMTLSTASTLKDACRNGHCPSSSQSDLDSTSTSGTISTVGFIIGGVGLAVGVLGIVMSKHVSETTQTGLRLVPTGNGVGGTF